MEYSCLQYLYDHDRNTYLDCVNNVLHVGHCNPRISKIINDQSLKICTNIRYLHSSIAEYSQALIKTFPESLDVCFFTNSGTESNEVALRLATTYCHSLKKKHVFLCLEHGYHGNSMSTVDVSHYKFGGKGGQGAKSNVFVLPMIDSYRGETIDYIKVNSIFNKIKHEDFIPILIFEAISGVGGYTSHPIEYIQYIYNQTKELNGIYIADEVQTGFMRTGEWNYAFELYNIIPDIVTLGKPMGNGYPLGGAVTNTILAKSFDNGMEYFNTFGGNQVAMRVGLEVLNIIEDDGLKSHAYIVGKYFREMIWSLKCDIIGDVRGFGLFIGVEIVRDKQSKIPAADLCKKIVDIMKEEYYVLLSIDGYHNNVFKIKPCMYFSKDDVDYFIESLKGCLGILGELEVVE